MSIDDMEIESLKVRTDITNIQSDITEIQSQLEGLIDLFYPVGSYYETSNLTFDPNVSWGGTWSEDTKGYVTVGADAVGDSGLVNTGLPILDVGETVGEKDHPLTVAEMPTHNHTIGENNLWGQISTYGYINPGATSSAGRADIMGNTTNYVGGGQPHNNMQPSIGVRRWHRKA